MILAPKELSRLAETFVLKCSLKDKKGYSPDTYPNPGSSFHGQQTTQRLSVSESRTNFCVTPSPFYSVALQFHHEQLQATAFREEYDPETFVDLTLPKYEMFRKVCVASP